MVIFVDRGWYAENAAIVSYTVCWQVSGVKLGVGVGGGGRRVGVLTPCVVTCLMLTVHLPTLASVQ